MRTARDIYQSNLDAVSQFLWQRDVVGMLDHIALPNMMLTMDAQVVISTRDEMAEAMNRFRDHLESIRAESYHRICQDAKFLGPERETILGWHTTYILRGGTYLIEPVSNQMTLMLIGGRWKGVRLETATLVSDCPSVSPEMAARQRLGQAGRDTRGLPS
ncbi:hypothetical protein ACOXXX_03925 [Thalassococcus sp. BH17M4-6]|uniref:hypothetical protein n=1 Tax=Thalassococcus sp. BH17M4-6 TaxID=3413148 RepID=UPI003BD93DE8